MRVEVETDPWLDPRPDAVVARAEVAVVAQGQVAQAPGDDEPPVDREGVGEHDLERAGRPNIVYPESARDVLATGGWRIRIVPEHEPLGARYDVLVAASSQN